MKARLFTLLALVLGMVSCQTEPEGFDVIVGGEVDTTITVTIPESETRADSSSRGVFNNGILDDDNVTMRYILEIWYGGEKRDRMVEFSDDKTVVFPIRLVPDRHYNFVVWADVVTKEETEAEFADADNHYNTADLTAVTYNGTWTAMDETRDAFTGYFNTEEEGRTYTSGLPIDINLIRPFAKLRVITTDFDELAKYGIKATSGKVTYSSEYNRRASFNACIGKASDAITTFLGGSGSYDIVAYTSETNDARTIFSDYIFASTDGDIVKFDLEIYEDGGNRIKANSFNTDICVKRNYITTLKGDVLTTSGNVTVTVLPGFGEEEILNYYVDTPEAAQAALDKAGKGTTIILAPDVNYGTLYIRPVAGASNTITDCDYLVYRNEMLRKVEDLTIVGAPDAIVEAIVVEAGYVKNSGSTGYVVDIKNLKIDSVEFADTHTNAPHSYAAPIFIDLTYINVDGLTVNNCKLIGDNAKMNFVYFYGSGNPSNSTFETAAKNITITNNTVDGIARLCELRQTENVTISHNTIKNTYLHGMLLTVDNGVYNGNVYITDNTAEGIRERFVRMAGAGDAAVVISNNTIINYQGADADYIKVTDGNATIENNTISYGINTAEQFIAALNGNGHYIVNNDIEIEDNISINTFSTRTNTAKTSVIDLNGHTIRIKNTGTEAIATIEENNTVTFVGEGSIVVSNDSTAPFIKNKGAVELVNVNLEGNVFSDDSKVTATYEINDAEGLMAFAAAVDAGNTFEGQTVKLAADIDLSAENWTPIGDNRTDAYFCGVFDGQNHTITGAHITGDHCFNGNVYGSKEGWGLFSVTDGATIKNLKVDGAIFGSYTVISGTIAAYANDTIFENIDITNSKVAGYNWYTGGVVGWAQGECTFKDVNLDETVAVGTLWDSHGQNAGGIAGGVSSSAKITIKDCNIACVMDVINDVTSNYKWYIYRVSGMIIGNTNTTETKYNEVVTATATNVTCENVTVTYGKWMNYHYCEGFWDRGWGRYESSDYVGGVDEDEPHNHAEGEEHCACFPFDQLFGGSSNGSGHYPVKGLAEFPGVTVYYPAEYTCPVCGKQHNVR